MLQWLERLAQAPQADFFQQQLKIDAHFGFNIEPGVWRLKRALSGGGPLLNVGIYCLQATRYLSGEEPTWISATTTKGDPTRFSEVEESVTWETKFPGGAISHCSSTYNARVRPDRTAGGAAYRLARPESLRRPPPAARALCAHRRPKVRPPALPVRRMRRTRPRS
jgi:predicted dehydrogenase